MANTKKPCNCKEENQKNLSIISKRETMAKNNTFKQVEVRYVGNARRVSVDGVGMFNNGEWKKIREDVGLRLAGQKSFELKSSSRGRKSQDKEEEKEEKEEEENPTVEPVDIPSDFSVDVTDEDRV